MLEYVLSLLLNAILLAGIGIAMVIVNHFITKSDFIYKNYRWVIYLFRVFTGLIFIASAAFTVYAVYSMLFQNRA